MSARFLFLKNIRTLICVGLVLTSFLVGATPAIFNLTVDPYQVFVTHDRSTKINDIAEKKHYPLWKLAKYRRGKHQTVILGDSRARALQDKYWHELGMTDALNLAYGGGTVPEILATFEIIQNDPAVRNVVIGIQLRSMDEDHKNGMNRVPEAVKLLRNEGEYLKNWGIAKTAFDVFQAEHASKLSKISALKPELVGSVKAAELGHFGKVPLSKLLEPEICFGCELPQDLASILETRRELYHHGIRGFGYGHRGWATALKDGEWADVESLYHLAKSELVLPDKHARQVHKNGVADWRGFEFSEAYWAGISKLAKWSQANGKRLVFFVPPTVAEMQRTIQTAGLGKLNHQFRTQLAKLGTVVDFDFGNELTGKAANFNDAYHFNSKIARMIVGELATLLSNDGKVIARAEKRRKLINCDFAHEYSTGRKVSKSVKVFENSNCRLWRKNS